MGPKCGSKQQIDKLRASNLTMPQIKSIEFLYYKPNLKINCPYVRLKVPFYKCVAENAVIVAQKTTVHA